jgi:competence protein ComEC
MSFAVIALYLALVGQQASVLRASVMVGVVLLGSLIGRRVSPLDAISLSVVLLMLFEPALSMNYGFALSVLATLGLLVLAPKLVEFFETKMPSWLAVMISVSLAAQIACLPVLLMLQPKVPVYSILANVLAEPLVAPITVLGLLACLCSPFAPLVTTCLSMLASYPALFIVWVGNFLASAPYASLSWFGGVGGLVLGGILTIAIWAVFVSKVNRVRLVAGFVAVVVLVSFGTQSSIAVLQKGNFYSGKYTLINCDVGQGDALVIRSKGEVAVVDVGREDPAIDSCLNQLGIVHINLLVLTHFDMDHIGGVVGAVTGRQVDRALITSFNDTRPGADFANSYLTGLGIELVKAEVGMTGVLGDFNWLVLTPHKGGLEAQDSNDGSVTMLWEDSTIALFTMADLGERGQLRVGAEQGNLLNSGFGGRVVVVKVAHHGSADQASEFYQAIKPQLALISVGEHNSYGHPTNRALEMLSSVSAQVIRTDQSGAIGVSEAGSGLSVSVSGRS